MPSIHLHIANRVLAKRATSALTIPARTLTFPLHAFQPSARFLSTTHRRLDSSPKAPHPEVHGTSSKFSEGVSDYSKQDDTTKTGAPEEPAGGPPPPPLAARSTPDLFSLKDRTIIVTGGARGLGLMIAQAALESGANVSCLDLLPHPSETEWPAAEKLAKERNLKLTYTPVDITDQAQVSQRMKELFDAAPSHAPVRGVFHSAGIQLLMPALDYKPEQVRKIIDVNTNGSFFVAQAFAREYLARNPDSDASEEVKGAKFASDKGASIVLTASMSGHVANKGLWCAAYNSSKAAVHAMAKCFAMEWSEKGIRVNTISPGYIRTALTAALLDQDPELNKIWLGGSLLGRLSTPDEFRGPAVYLLSDASSFMTGADLLVDGGHTAT